MKSKIKQILKTILRESLLLEAFKKYNSLCIKELNFKKNKKERIVTAIKILPRVSFACVLRREYDVLTEAILFKEICKKVKINFSPSEVFYYNPDFFVLSVYKSMENWRNIGNITVDYSIIIKKGIKIIKQEIEETLKRESNKEKFLKALLYICEGMEIYIKRVLDFLCKNYKDKKDLIEIISEVPYHPASSFKGALQSFLFLNSFLWMNGHPLIGLGRLDQLFFSYYWEDLKQGKINVEEAKSLLKEFIKMLYKHFKYKSNVLPGDTGQVIVIGGKDKNGKDLSNDLTLLFIEVMKELKLPDPKLVLRVHSNTSQVIWDKAIELLSLGLGYPLLCNDDRIIPSLIKFGYEEDDAYNYVVSACWEPHIQGLSFDQNNLFNFNLLEPLHKLLKSKKHINNFQELLDKYFDKVEKDLKDILEKLKDLKFKPSPLLSLFTNCKEKDISVGGAKYNHVGILTVGLGNVIDSLFNIKRLLWEEKKIVSLSQIYSILQKNFSNEEILLEDLKNNGLKFGMDNKLVIEITNKIVERLEKTVKKYTNPLGGKYKVGLSSPLFVELGRFFEASFDGRKKGEPLGVHISPVQTSISYTSLFNFSSSLEYEKAFNGGVTDIIIEANLIKRHKLKIVSLIQTFFKMGGLQLQINVLDSKRLIEAQKHPERFPNLIVRVWGFSTYFKDLPKEYQDLIIKRLKQYESLHN